MEPRKSSLIDTFKSLPRAGQIIVGLVLVAGLIFVGSAAISGVVTGLSTSLVNPTPAPTTAVQQANGTTPDVLPTDTPAPTAPPTHDQIDQQLASVAGNGVLFSQHLDANYFTDDKSVVITELLMDWADKSGGQTEVKSDCFTTQQNLWTDHSLHLSDVEVHFTANLVDQFGHPVTGMVALCDLKAARAAQFVWGNLDGGIAWDAHDYDAESFSPPLA